MVYLDMTKASDGVPIITLLSNPVPSEFSTRCSLGWPQVAMIGNHLVLPKSITSGVTLGSTPAPPQLFLMHTNDILSLFQYDIFVIFAGDMKLLHILHSTDLPDFVHHFECDLNSLCQWCPLPVIQFTTKKHYFAFQLLFATKSTHLIQDPFVRDIVLRCTFTFNFFERASHQRVRARRANGILFPISS